MIKCIAIDDEPKALKILKMFIEKVHFLELSGLFRSPLSAMDFLRENEIDLMFLDISMPDLSGIQFLDILQKPPLVIFTTAYSEYAVESYDYAAIDYLLKPFEFERFLKAVNKASEQILQRKSVKSPLSLKNFQISKDGSDTIFVKSGTEYHQIHFNDILYIEGAGNFVTFITQQEKILSSITLKRLIEILPDDEFIRIHKSYIISLKHVKIVKTDRVKINKKLIPIGDKYKDNLLRVVQGKDFRQSNT